MNSDAIIMMIVILAIVWGGFIASLVIAFLQDKTVREE